MPQQLLARISFDVLLAAIHVVFHRTKLSSYFIGLQFNDIAHSSFVIEDFMVGRILELTIRKVQSDLTEIYFSDPYPPDFSSPQVKAFESEESFDVAFYESVDYFPAVLLQALGDDVHIWTPRNTAEGKGEDKGQRRRGLNANTIANLRALVEIREEDFAKYGKPRRRKAAYDEAQIDRKTVARHLPDLVRKWSERNYRKGEIEEIIKKLEGI